MDAPGNAVPLEVPVSNTEAVAHHDHHAAPDRRSSAGQGRPSPTRGSANSSGTSSGPAAGRGPPAARAPRGRHGRTARSHARPMSAPGDYRRNGMPHQEIDGVPIWYEEHGDPAGPPLVALHGGIITFQGTFGDVLPWLSEGRRVIGVELQGHGHTPDTGRAMSIERFADDVAQLIDRVAD